MTSYDYITVEDGEDLSLASTDGLYEHQKKYLSRRSLILLLMVLTISLLFNVHSVNQGLHRHSHLVPTKYASLVRNTPIPFVLYSNFVDEDRAIADEAWKSPDLDPATGVVALPNEISESMDLPPAQRWPWDHSKGIYLLNAYHNLHCLHVVREATLDFFDGKGASKTLEHVTHCLNVLREEIVCNADDTPRYTGAFNAEVGKVAPTSGIGQIKMCNDWGKLGDFAVKHSACYKPINKSDPYFPTADRYKFCPDGTTPWL